MGRLREGLAGSGIHLDTNFGYACLSFWIRIVLCAMKEQIRGDGSNERRWYIMTTTPYLTYFIPKYLPTISEHTTTFMHMCY